MLAHNEIPRAQTDQQRQYRQDYRATRSRAEDDARDPDRRAFHSSSNNLPRELRHPESRPLSRDSPPRQPPARERNPERTYHRDPPPALDTLHHRASLKQPLDAAGSEPIDSIQVPNPSKIYIGGLPEITRPEDLQDCFSQLGRIKNVELKTGYGFVEYDSPQAACDAVSKYHEGTFLGSHIKVELSHGGSRPRHVAVSNNPEACYTCGIIGHWARDCPDADSSLYSKRRLRARSLTPPPPRHRENGYLNRDPRSEVELSALDHRPHRRRSPLGEIDYARVERERVPPAPRESYFQPAHPEAKRHRPENTMRDRERDEQRALHLKIAPRAEDHRAPYLITPSRSRSPPPGSRDYYLSDRSRPADPYSIRSLPRDDHQSRVHVLKSYPPEPAYYRDHGRPSDPAATTARIGRYEDRSPGRQNWAYPVERVVDPTRVDRRYEVVDSRVPPRGHSPRRARSPRRSPSPSRRPSSHRRHMPRMHSPAGYEHPGYARPAYPLRR